MLAQRAIVHYFCVCESAHIKLNARAYLGYTTSYHISKYLSRVFRVC